MLKEFKKFILQHKLFGPLDRVLLAVSGGADSVVMAELFHRAGFRFAMAHCNFQLRGKDSEADEKFVRQLAAKYNVECFVVSFKTKAIAKQQKKSLQQAARDLRYEWFASVAEEGQFQHIATAHHLNDSIETFFINLLRGTGISGLTGIPLSTGKIIRPMLFASRREIEAFTKEEKIKFRHDVSNDSDDYLRNRIRHHLIPLLSKLNPQLEEIMLQNIRNLSNAKEQLLFSIFGFNGKQVQQILATSKTGGQFFSEDFRATIDRSQIIIEKHSVKNLEWKFSIVDKAETVQPDTHLLDYDLLAFPITIRKWRAGDHFVPFGMKGKKKLSDFLIDSKVSRSDKDRIQVLLSGNNIVAVLGHRIDERYKVTTATKKIVKIEYLRTE